MFLFWGRFNGKKKLIKGGFWGIWEKLKKKILEQLHRKKKTKNCNETFEVIVFR